jgi:hypothetical protein
MIVVRNTFVATPGNASKLAAQFKKAAAAAKMPKHRVLTDMTGDFNRVILEYEVDDLKGFDAQMKEYATNEALRNGLKGYTELYVTGARELLQVV